MSLILDGTNGLSDVDGTAAAPAIRGTDANTGIFFPAADTIAFAEGGVEAMRIDSSGNVGIGVTPAFKLDISGSGTTAKFNTLDTHDSGASISTWQKVGRRAGTGTNAYINTVHSGSDAVSALTWAFGTSGTGTEAMRIESSGNLLVGTTSNGSNARLVVASAVNTQSEVLSLAASSGNVFGKQIVITQNISDTTSRYLTCETNNGNTAKLYIYSNGNVVNANNSYGSLSDSKLKENIVDATPKLAGLMQVKVRNYNLIGDEQKQIGVIAQELEQLFPSMIDESPDRDVEGNDLGTTTKSVKYSVFVPMLIKAIQEQQALITALTTRITALEGVA